MSNLIGLGLSSRKALDFRFLPGLPASYLPSMSSPFFNAGLHAYRNPLLPSLYNASAASASAAAASSSAASVASAQQSFQTLLATLSAQRPKMASEMTPADYQSIITSLSSPSLASLTSLSSLPSLHSIAAMQVPSTAFVQLYYINFNGFFKSFMSLSWNIQLEITLNDLKLILIDFNRLKQVNYTNFNEF